MASSPMTQSVFWILTALAQGRRHGYEILQDAERSSEGRVKLKVTTLYATLERLEREGLIVADGQEVVSGRARRYYRIADEGAVRLASEVALLEQSVRVARTRLVLPTGTTAPAAVASVVSMAPAAAIAPQAALGFAPSVWA